MTLSAVSASGDGTAVRQFDSLVDKIKKADIKLATADALLQAAQQNPALAEARRQELSLPIINGVPMIAAETPSSAAPTRPNTTMSAVIAFDTLVDSIKATDARMTWADAILAAAAKDPALTQRRNQELASGAVSLTSV